MLYSFGHSTKALDEFVRLVRGARIEVVADIRRFPRSRRHPHFARERLDQTLPAYGIAYVWLGEELGGFREPDYESWMRTPDFERGIVELEALASTRTVGFMCSEGLASKCHRAFVAQALLSRGHAVSHLLPDGSFEPVGPLPPVQEPLDL
jgi:uncharacterized protein (DUF488 family)